VITITLPDPSQFNLSNHFSRQIRCGHWTGQWSWVEISFRAMWSRPWTTKVELTKCTFCCHQKVRK